MDGAWLGLAGVVVGSATSFAATWVNTRAGAKNARNERLAARAQQVRENLGSAFLDSTEALQWLSNQHVEDSVSPHFADSYRPRTEAALVKLRTARRTFGLVATQGISLELSELCMQVSVTLNTLDDAWHQCQEYASKLADAREKEKALAEQAQLQATQAGEAPSGKKPRTFAETYKRMFDTSYDRLLKSREALTGLDGGARYHEEVDQGVVLSGSLLHRVREGINTVEESIVPD